ncbi:MAG: hydrolase or metal-binding protein [Pseudoxanthomonas sp.]
MLKGLAITPPVVGRISIGRVIERKGKRLPEKDDQFTLTTQVQTGSGWINHPLNDTLPKDDKGKLRSIPVRLMFNAPELNLRADYHLFDRKTGRATCVGNGEKARRFDKDNGIVHVECPGPDGCPFAKGECKAYARFNVLVGDGTDDALGSFVLRSTSINTIRTIAARLEYFRAVSGGRLACMPLELKLRGKSTRMSFGATIYYVDLVVRSGLTLEQAIAEAIKRDTERKEAGFDQQALDQAATQGFANGAFEELDDDGTAVIEEFYPPAKGEQELQQKPVNTNGLRGKLEAKAAKLPLQGEAA